MIITNESNSNYKPCPKGPVNAVCVDIVDLGMVKVTFKGKEKLQHKCRVVWEVDKLMEDGKRFLAMKRYTASTNENSNLRKDLKTWRGVDFTQDEIKAFNLENIVGAPCTLLVSHNTRNEKTYADVDAVMPCMGNKLMPTGDYKRVKDRPAKEQPQIGDTQVSKQAAAEELEESDIPF